MWLTEVTAVLPDGLSKDTSIRLENGVIAELRAGGVPQPDLRGGGCLLLPGLVDVHGDMLERDIEPRPRATFPTDLALFELDKRLAALGVTTAFAAISFAAGRKRTPLRSERRAHATTQAIAALRDTLLIDMRVHARYDVTNPGAGEVLLELLRARQLALVTLNDHTPGQGQYRDLERHIAQLAAERQRSEAEVRQEVEARLTAADATPPDWAVVQHVCQEVLAQGLPLASHDDDSPDKVARMARLGVRVSEFPVTLAAAHEAKRRGMTTVMGAPNAYRGHSNSGNLSALEAIRLGLVDVLAADYYPAAMLHVVFKLEADGILPLHEAVKLVSLHPAQATGLADRGCIAVGKRADLVLVEPGALHRVRGTLRGGRVIYWDGQLSSLATPRPTALHAEGTGRQRQPLG